MTTAPADVDPNVQQANKNPFRPSKIPGTLNSQHLGSTSRASPFSFGTTLSPRSSVMPPPPRSVLSPTVSSKLPRKSRASSQILVTRTTKYDGGTGLQRSSLPFRGGRTSLAAVPSTPTETQGLTPPSTRDKSLPSPPIVQIIDPDSPPKAQRTLVDAESGALSRVIWPVLLPENTSPSDSHTSSAESSNTQQRRSISDGAAPRQTNSIYLAEMSSPAVDISDSTVNATLVQEAPLFRPQSRQKTDIRIFGSRNPFMASFHAISPSADIAMDSPLAHKQNALLHISVPPRVSSNRISISSSALEKPRSSTLPVLQSRPASPQSIKWPMPKASRSQHEHAEDTTHDLTHAAHFSQTRDTADVPHRLLESNSTWSLAAGSSLDEDQASDHRDGTRIKRISWKSKASGSGPVLTIHGDAENILLSRISQIQDVPSLPEILPVKCPQEHSLSSLTRHFTRQPKPKLSSTEASPISLPISNDVRTPLHTVKISPIRSMQPARHSCLDDIASVSSSPTSPKSVNVVIPRSQLVIDKDDITKTRLFASSTTCSSEFIVTSKAKVVFGAHPETSKTLTRKPTTANWYSPSLTSSNSKVAGSDRGKTSPSLVSAGNFRSLEVMSGLRLPGSNSPTDSRKGQSHDKVRRPGPSNLRASESARPTSGQGSLDRTNQLAIASSRLPPSEESSIIDTITTINPAMTSTKQRIHIKRSFRSLFSKRDDKRPESPTTEIDPKKASRTDTRGSLVNRIRAPANFSKTHLSSTPEALLIPETPATLETSDVRVAAPNLSFKATHRQAALSSLEGTSPRPVLAPSTVLRYESEKVINDVLDRVDALPTDSSDRVRGVEVAEVCPNRPPRSTAIVLIFRMKKAVLHAVECFEAAKFNAEMAEKHARGAEANAERLGKELQLLQRLCESHFDPETIRQIKERIEKAETIGVEDETV